MRRLYEIVLSCEGKTKPLEPRKFFDKKNGPGGAKEYRINTEALMPDYTKLLIIRGPDHDKFIRRGR